MSCEQCYRSSFFHKFERSEVIYHNLGKYLGVFFFHSW